MTTAPVMTITEELLAELEEKAKAAVPACCGEMIPSGVEHGGQREMMCCEAWQDCDVTVDALDLLALIAHLRSLEARVEKVGNGIEWISVDERLPEQGEWLVTVDTDCGQRVHVLELDRKGNWIHEGEPTFCHGYCFRVVAWAQRPEPAPVHESEGKDDE